MMENPMSPLSIPLPRLPLAILVAGAAGAARNLYGLAQFAGTLTATQESLISAGLTAEQAVVMTGYPAWMTLAFGLGATGGLAGSLLLLWRPRLATPVLALSLVAYVALWIGDAVHGVFAALGPSQVAILTLVVAIAAGLLALSRANPAR